MYIYIYTHILYRESQRERDSIAHHIPGSSFKETARVETRTSTIHHPLGCGGGGVKIIMIIIVKIVMMMIMMMMMIMITILLLIVTMMMTMIITIIITISLFRGAAGGRAALSAGSPPHCRTAPPCKTRHYC